MISTRKRAGQALRRGVVRFRELLEQARGLHDLVQDGREKSGGEYIFDRQYVASLIESALLRMARMVFDARVLAPRDADALYAAYDDCRQEAARLLSVANHEPGGEGNPEFRVLREVVHWMEAGPASPLDLLGDALDRAAAGLEDVVRSAVADRSAASHRLELVDLEGLEDGSEGEPASARALRNRALRRMLAGAECGEPEGRWLAVVCDQRLSLFGPRDGSRIVVEAALSGEPARDFVFLWAEADAGARAVAAAGLEARATKLGRIAWSHDLPTPELEEKLVRLGGALWVGDRPSR